MARELLDKYLDDSVTGSGQDVWSAPDIPADEPWHLTKFGGTAGAAAVIGLQLRTGTSPDVWTMIRAGIGPGQFEFDVDRDYVGDGTKKFRVVRQEKSGSAQQIIAWLEGYKVT
jgi:hypothetical protein